METSCLVIQDVLTDCSYLYALNWFINYLITGRNLVPVALSVETFDLLEKGSTFEHTEEVPALYIEKADLLQP
ncbi:hypothetical protein Peur_004274 [Populus x canadensis]